jgi:subtilisin family serine protease
MKHVRPLALVAVFAAACSDPAAPRVEPSNVPDRPSFSQAPAGQEAQPIADQYIVVFDDGVADAPGLARRMAASQNAEVRHTYQHALKGFSARMSAQAAEALARNPNVAYVEQDQVVTASTTQSSATWGIDRIDARSGLSGTFTYHNTGSGVTAYIIDTGIDVGHAEFTGRLSTAHFDAFTDGKNGDDCNGHGTHVAGTVGGTTYGVAKGVTLVRVRVLDCAGSGSWSGVVAGVDWVVSHHGTGPAVSNMSLGGGASTTVDDAVKRMIADGVASAVAAGNGNQAGIAQDACRYSPARVPDAMTIGATTKTDAKTSWSNYGTCVDFFAPGAGITAAWIGGGNTETNTISGTSMATPHVAGVAALYLQSNTAATPLQVRDALYAATTKGVVTSSRTANNHLLYTSY